ncbi:trypsin-like peptidase domain-containing protein [Streptomyces sioyaensis]|uniref:trypsin-like peptidase domain-containing protein n=1 Tax=Streptomyces sioyaensis TaxID=67364 RepID=UPI0037B268EA
MKTALSASRRRPLAAAISGILAAGLLLGGTPAQAAHPSSSDALAKPTARADKQAPLIDASSADGERFRASGRLIGGLSSSTTCTATLVSATNPSPSAKALILTNGHCVRDTMKTNEVIVNEPAPHGWSFTPAYFHDNIAEHRTFPVRNVAYATMKDTDIAVLELQATYKDLAELRVAPRTVSADRPASGQALRAAHAPSVGVDPDEQFLRLSVCRVTASPVALHEHTWLWKDVARTDCLGVSGGSSGGPVTTADGNRLVALINTVSTPGYLGCGLGRPCEGSASGLAVPQDNTAYAIPVDAVASCLDSMGLQLDKSGCRLDPGEQVDVTSSGQETQSHTPHGPARWDAHITPVDTAQHKYAAFKSGPFGVVDCTDPLGYTRPRRLPADGLDYTHILPTRDNLYVLCVAGGPDDNAGRWGKSFHHPSYAFARVDNTPPTASPEINIEDSDADYWVRPLFLPWEITRYEIKYGPTTTTDCNDVDGYRPYRKVPVTLPKAGAPWTVCLVGYDNADNATPPANFAVPSES